MNQEHAETIAQITSGLANLYNFHKSIGAVMAEKGLLPEDVADAFDALAAISGDDPIFELDELQGL